MLVEYLNRPWFLIGLLLVLGGFDIGMSWTYLPRLLGIFLILIGILLIATEIRAQKRKTASEGETTVKKKTEESDAPRLSSRLIKKLTFNGRLIPFLWIIGIFIVVADIILNAIVLKSAIGGNDLIVLFFGVSLIIYAPPTWMRFGVYLEKYAREKDFIVVFLGLIALILVLPMYIDALLTRNAQGSESGVDYLNGDMVYILLTAPLSGILSVLGVENYADGYLLHFKMANGDWTGVGIAATCAGLYSFGIFLSAFIAFILSEYSRFTRRIGILLVVGSLLTYLANLLRMTFIVLAGYYNGIGDTDNPAPFTLLWTHKYAGEIIFISWVAIFWWVAFKYLASESSVKPRRATPIKRRNKTETSVGESSESNYLKEKVFKLRKGKIA